MHKIVVIDINAYSPMHDNYLCNALAEQAKESVVMIATPAKLEVSSKIKQLKCIKFIPERFQNSNSKIKKTLRGIEAIVNYILICFYIKKLKIDNVHFQWLPFIGFCSLDLLFLRFIKLIRPESQIFLSVHNLFPHDISEISKKKYIGRFKELPLWINKFITHTEVSRYEVATTYDIDKSKIGVTHLGIYPINKYLNGNESLSSKQNKKMFRIMMFGLQSYYKGTDLLINAIKELDYSNKEKVEVVVAGKFAPAYFENVKTIETGANIIWKPYFLADDELYREIESSDVIVLPYREISQSGALLTALNFNKPLLASDLPSFKETLFAYDDDMFFKNGDYQDLMRLIKRYINKELNVEDVLKRNERIKSKFTWSNTAKQTLTIYGIK